MLKIGKRLLFCGILFFILCTTTACNNTAAGECEKIYIAAVDAYTAGNLDTALSLVRKAKIFDVRFYQADLLEAKILFFQDQYAGAQKILRKLVKKYPEYTEARIWNIRCIIFMKNYAEAERLLENELSFNQTDWRVYYLYSVLALRTNNYNERLAMSRRAEWALVDSSKVYMDMAMLWNTLGMKDRARGYILKAKTVSGTQSRLAELEKALETVIASGEGNTINEE